MATTDTKVDLVINELSEEQLQALKTAGTVTPNQLWGTPDVSDDNNIEKVETIYDMNSTDSNINWGYTSGIGNGVTINKNFNKYKMLWCQYQSYNNAIVAFCDLTMPTTPSDTTGRYVLYAVGYIGSGYQELISIINLEKTTLTTYLPGSGVSAAKITKIYGVY